MGALDRKHMDIRCPKQSGFRYYNYKGFCSMAMLCLVDADYKFRWIDMVSNGVMF